MAARIRVDRQAVSHFCRRHHVRRLSLFGSVLTEQFGPASDVDVLVEFEDGHVPGYFALIGLQDELAQILGVREVDLHTPNDLSRHFRDEVLASAEVQYGEA
ncbi:MAG: nucleotidyltransferase family protein [Euryarchaeota archaeon]|nr:nucleotidyltransferase family protein [Euryarchaeota archaeon]